MPADATPPMRELRDAIRRYLGERPDAADTLTGIAQWWLPEAMRGVSIDMLRLALAGLIASQEVRCMLLPDGSELYARAGGQVPADDGSETN